MNIPGYDKPTSYIISRPFRRMTRALLIPVSATASSYSVPDAYIRPEYDSFLVINPNQCWVGLRGTSWTDESQPKPTIALMADDDGADWLFPPGHVSVWSTQFPEFMSAMALPMPGYSLPPADGYTPLRVYYGNGS